MTCGRTQEFLAKNSIESAEIVDAKKRTIGEKEALALAKDMDEIYASKGKKVVHIDMGKDKPDAATLRSVLIGPSGNLRAPTLRIGRILLVGFDETSYKAVLGR
jgi:arsenate reductase-like glutaredoxin family protein